MGTLTKEHIVNVCQPGKKEITCSFLTMGADGFMCAKTDISIMQQIMTRRFMDQMTAKGDNCEGREGLV